MSQSTSCCSSKGDKLPVAMNETSSREPVVVNARHEAPCHWSFTGVTAPFVVQLTTTTNGYELPSASDHHKPPSSHTFNRRFETRLKRQIPPKLVMARPLSGLVDGTAAIDGVLLGGQDGVAKLNKAAIARRGDHRGTIELQAVQINLPVAGALKVRIHEVPEKYALLTPPMVKVESKDKAFISIHQPYHRSFSTEKKRRIVKDLIG